MNKLLLLALLACEPAQTDFGPQPDGGDAALWLSTQNAVRAAAQPAPSPALTPFVWSESAAQIAQSYSQNCVYQHNPNRGPLGENIAASAPPGSWTLTNAVNAWASETSFYDYATNTCAANQQCGHYTQIVWRDTQAVGCGHTLCTANSPFSNQQQWDFWVCDYSPPGNYVGQKPY
jgi:hypothetical protein